MNLESVTIRNIQPDEAEPVVALLVAGFGGEPERVRHNLSTNPRYTLTTDVFVAEYEGRLVGTATVFPAKMWLSGVPLDVGAVAGVTVLPEYRENGIAPALMKTLLAKMYADGRALSLLFPFSNQYYRKFGYGTAGDLHAYRLAPANLVVTGSADNVRPYQQDDLAMLRVVYKGLMTWHNGWFTRSNEQWAKIVSKWPQIMVYDNDDTIDGYLMYVSSVGPDGERVLSIKEFFAGEPAAYQGLLAWLAAQAVDVIEYMAPADTPLKHSLFQPMAYNAQNRGWIFSDLCQVTPGPMARIINLAKALTTRFYTRGVSGERVLKVTDPFIPENEVPIVFRLVDGRAETRPAEGKAPQIETDIATLSEMLCGYLSAADARRVGRLITDEDTAIWLDKIIVDTPLFIQGGDWF